MTWKLAICAQPDCDAKATSVAEIEGLPKLFCDEHAEQAEADAPRRRRRDVTK